MYFKCIGFSQQITLQCYKNKVGRACTCSLVATYPNDGHHERRAQVARRGVGDRGRLCREKCSDGFWCVEKSAWPEEEHRLGVQKPGTLRGMGSKLSVVLHDGVRREGGQW